VCLCVFVYVCLSVCLRVCVESWTWCMQHSQSGVHLLRRGGTGMAGWACVCYRETGRCASSARVARHGGLFCSLVGLFCLYFGSRLTPVDTGIGQLLLAQGLQLPTHLSIHAAGGQVLLSVRGLSCRLVFSFPPSFFFFSSFDVSLPSSTLVSVRGLSCRFVFSLFFLLVSFVFLRRLSPLFSSCTSIPFSLYI